MIELCIDCETRSNNDITLGIEKYTDEDSNFEILILAYKFSDEKDYHCVDVKAGEQPCARFFPALRDPSLLKTSYNFAFEHAAILKHYGIAIPYDQCECTQAKCAQLALPMHLEGVAKALNLPIQKDTSGKEGINMFSVPQKPSKKNNYRTAPYEPWEKPKEWLVFKRYCVIDVMVEVAIRERVAFYKFPAFEKALWILDQKINNRGVKIDTQLARNAFDMFNEYKAELIEEAAGLTGLSNPNSRAQLLTWINETDESDLTKLRIEDYPVILKNTNSEQVKRIIHIRKQTSKTSVSKYNKMLAAQRFCDGRVCNQFKYCGANRTWRWAGRVTQLHNLPRNDMKHLDYARRLVLKADRSTLLKVYPQNLADILSQLIRTALVPAAGHSFVAVDFSAVESKVTAWLADEHWKIEEFNKGTDMYKVTYAKMFGIPVEQVTKDQRQVGKVGELALGFGGGDDALARMDVKKAIKPEDRPVVKTKWREINPNIVKSWHDVNRAAISAIENKGYTYTACNGKLRITYAYGMLIVALPSGRNLHYVGAHLRTNKFGRPGVCYMGKASDKVPWGLVETHGGKLIENIVQALARDLLATSMLRVSKKYNIVIHVHDELVVEVPDSIAPEALKEIEQIMSEVPAWAKGMPSGAVGFITKYYKKED